MRKLLTILFFIVPFMVLSQDYDSFLPDVSWRTIVDSVVYQNVDTFTVKVAPTDLNDPGAFQKTVGNFLIDNKRRKYKIIDDQSLSDGILITVVDVFKSGAAPYQGLIGFVVDTPNGAFASGLSTYYGEKLDESSEEYERAIDLRIAYEKGQSIPFDSMMLDTNYIQTGTEPKGTMFWDSSRVGIGFKTDIPDVTVNPGLENLIRVYNGNNFTIENSKVVYPDPITGIGLADNRERLKSTIVAVATHDILPYSLGWVTKFGDVDGFDLIGFEDEAFAFLGENGNVTNTRPTGGRFLTLIGAATEAGIDGILFVDITALGFTAEVMDFTGWPDENDDSFPDNVGIVLDDATRTLYLTATPASSYYYYENGAKHIFEADTFQWSATEGVHLIYYDGEEIVEIVNPTDSESRLVMERYASIMNLYWDVSANTYIYVNNEFHTFNMSGKTKGAMHDIHQATVIEPILLTDFLVDQSGNVAADAQFGNTSGVLRNEDIKTTVPSKSSTTGYSVFYRTETSNWSRQIISGYGVVNTGTGRIAYNDTIAGVWQLVEPANGDYVYYIVVSSNTLGEKMGTIVGRGSFPTADEAMRAGLSDARTILNNLPIKEIALIGLVTYQTRDNYTNTVKGRIVSVTDPITGEVVEYIDLTAGNYGGGSAGASASNFIDLQDVFQSYAGRGDDFVTVATSEDGLTSTPQSDLLLSGFDTTGFTLPINNITGLVDSLADHELRISQNETDISLLQAESHPAVSMAGTNDYIIIDPLTQVITRNQIDLTTDVTGILPLANQQLQDLSGYVQKTGDVMSGPLIIRNTSGNEYDSIPSVLGIGISQFRQSVNGNGEVLAVIGDVARGFELKVSNNIIPDVEVRNVREYFGDTDGYSDWYELWHSGNFIDNHIDWDDAYDYSQVGHLPLAGGTLSGATIGTTIQANTYLRSDELRGKDNNELVINAGESFNEATGQTGESVYINAESGLEINSSPNNWLTGWADRHTTIINDANGDSFFDNNVSAPNFIGSLSGNATTATTLETHRTIWGQPFNGSSNVAGALSGATTGSFTGTVSTKDLYFNNSALITSDADGAFADRSGTNIDHVWHDEGTNTWHLVSDGTYKQQGNANVKALTFIGNLSGSADLLDGLNSTAFLRSSTHDETDAGVKTWFSGAIDNQSGSAATVQINGFMRTGNIYIHEGGITPTSAGLPLSNNAGDLAWDGQTIWHYGNFNPSNYVPYNGATNSLDLGAYKLTSTALQVNSPGTTIGGSDITGAWLRLGLSFGMDDNEIYWDSKTGVIGTIGDYAINFQPNSTLAMSVASTGVTFTKTIFAANQVDLTGANPRVDFNETDDVSGSNWNILVDAGHLDFRRTGTSNTSFRLNNDGSQTLYGNTTNTGAFTANGSIYTDGSFFGDTYFVSDDDAVVLGTSESGNIYIRPLSYNTATSQTVFNESWTLSEVPTRTQSSALISSDASDGWQPLGGGGTNSQFRTDFSSITNRSLEIRGANTVSNTFDGIAFNSAITSNGTAGAYTWEMGSDERMFLTEPTADQAKLTLFSQTGVAFGSILDFRSTNNQGVQIRHETYDSYRSPFGLIVEVDADNIQPTDKPWFEVKGAIYADGGYSNEWNTAYDDKINSIAVTGTTTRSITLGQQDGGSVSTQLFWTGTQAAYDALGTYDNNTIYFIED